MIHIEQIFRTDFLCISYVVARAGYVRSFSVM